MHTSSLCRPNCVDVCYLLLVPHNFFSVFRHPQFVFFHSTVHICVLSSIQRGTSVFSLPFSGAHLCSLFHSAGHICFLSSIQRGTSVFSLPFSGAHLRSLFHPAGHICVLSSIQRGTFVFYLPFSGAPTFRQN